MHACACTCACTHPRDVTLLQKETQTGTPSVVFCHLHLNHFPPFCFLRPHLALCFYLRGFFVFHFLAIYSCLYSTDTWWISVVRAPCEGSRGTNTSEKYKPSPRETYTLVQEQINTQRQIAQKPSKKLASHTIGEG